MLQTAKGQIFGELSCSYILHKTKWLTKISTWSVLKAKWLYWPSDERGWTAENEWKKMNPFATGFNLCYFLPRETISSSVTQEMPPLRPDVAANHFRALVINSMFKYVQKLWQIEKYRSGLAITGNKDEKF